MAVVTGRRYQVWSHITILHFSLPTLAGCRNYVQQVAPRALNWAVGVGVAFCFFTSFMLHRQACDDF